MGLTARTVVSHAGLPKTSGSLSLSLSLFDNIDLLTGAARFGAGSSVSPIGCVRFGEER